MNARPSHFTEILVCAATLLILVACSKGEQTKPEVVMPVLVTKAVIGPRAGELSYSGEVRQAQGVRVSVWANPGKFYEGTVREISPTTDPETRTYTAKIALVMPDRIPVTPIPAS